MFSLTVPLCIVLLLLRGGLAGRGDISSRILKNTCSSHNSCSDCIQHPECAWCSKPKFALRDGTQLDRCNPRAWFHRPDFMDANCDEFMVDMVAEITKIQDEPLTQRMSMKLTSKKTRVQIRPQKLSIRIRPNEPITIPVHFSQAADYPLDLYYIMDQSTSMEPHKMKLIELGRTLTETMQNITSDFRIGFGSFVDKTLTPFTNEALLQSWPAADAYLFQHHLTLSQDTDQLLAKLRDSKPHENLDYPEGGLEALMQAVVCKEQIGWRNDSRKLIVISTDSPYHIAGDAKLAGITKPNDEECHINKRDNYLYKHERMQDYPSLAQISRKIAENSMNVIFAVQSNIQQTYKDLEGRIQGSHVGVWSENSANIVQLIKSQYNKIRSTVELQHRASELTRVRYTSECLKKGRPVETNKCTGLKTGSVVQFNITVEVNICDKGKDFKEILEIYPVGINEALTIELDVLCECSCTKITKMEGDYDPCMGNGKDICGICECNPGYSGLKCECNEHNATLATNSKSCKAPNAQNQYEDCSGRGNCQCGVCHCNPRPLTNQNVWGKYCECDDYSCPVSNQQICSGPDHGDCQCGVCQCRPGWEGESCECPTDESGCVAPGSNEPICSDKGRCQCGRCQCFVAQEGFYSGTYCEICPTCSAQCADMKDCVRCLAFKTGPLISEECAQCQLNMTIQDRVEEKSDSEHLCSFYDETTCKFFFVYNELDLTSVLVQQFKECSVPPDAAAIGFGIMGTILLVGLLLLLILKILTTVHDRLEYIKFEKERAHARWERGDNPLYKRPTTIFSNPAYEEQSQSSSESFSKIFNNAPVEQTETSK